MCLTTSRIIGIHKWNWDGDRIIHDSVVPSSRPVVGFRYGHSYNIDVREFLVTSRNAVIEKTFREEIDSFIRSMPGGSPLLFKARGPGSFDYRAHVVTAFVSEKIGYKSRNGEDPWQFPDETLRLRSGDCEDRAFLIASLLAGAEISWYNIRVALGKVLLKRKGLEVSRHDHMWVMYKNERGGWTLIEPLVLPERAPGGRGRIYRGLLKSRHESHDETLSAEYIPEFLFNDRHLWAVSHQGNLLSFLDALALRKRWIKLHPKFAGAVHKSILNTALAGADSNVLNALNGYFNRIFIVGPIVDDVDRWEYNPLDHFDNCYVKEGWGLVEARLNYFKQDNVKNLNEFAYAAHGIADFYAHSSYVHFAEIQKGSRPEFDYASICDPANPMMQTKPAYDSESGYDLTSETFTINPFYWDLKKNPRKDIAQMWGGKIVSGRYAQKKDTWDSPMSWITEGPTNIPPDLEEKQDFYKRGSLPHHNEVAVDEESRNDSHRLYRDQTTNRLDRMSFANQFRWRKNAAIRHVRQAFQSNWTASPLHLDLLP
jgi:hypothetical protein